MYEKEVSMEELKAIYIRILPKRIWAIITKNQTSLSWEEMRTRKIMRAMDAGVSPEEFKEKLEREREELLDSFYKEKARERKKRLEKKEKAKERKASN